VSLLNLALSRNELTNYIKETIKLQENTGICHYVISVRKISVVDIKMLILAMEREMKLT